MTVYCDSSSLVKLYVDEPGADEVRRLVSEASVLVTSEVGYVEIRAALARLRRDRSITGDAFERARSQFDADWATTLTVDVTGQLLRAAGALTERHQLRALDAIHLASFVQLLERSTDADVYFSSFDARVSKAARKLS